MPDVDRIERTIILPIPVQRVWSALTEPRKIERWFGNKAIIKHLAPGEEIAFEWGDKLFRGVIEVVDPLKTFAYRWEVEPGDVSQPFDTVLQTLVTFTLEAVPEGTRLTLVESGFARLPEHLRLSALNANTRGWRDELDELARYMETEA